MPTGLVVFDLGGVLIRLRDPLETFGLSGTEGDFLERWLLSPTVRELERGAIDIATFARSMLAELGLAMHPAEFLERFNAWPDRLYPDAMALLDAIPEGIPRALLSNMNAAHWGREDIFGALAGRFDREFLSFRTGLLKPDAAAFEQVLDAYAIAPAKVLFFDDNPRNVSAAARLGIDARLCRGPAEALPVIRQLCG